MHSYTYTYIWMHAYMYVCTCAHTSALAHTHTHACTLTHIDRHTERHKTQIDTQSHRHTCTHSHIHARIHTHTRTHAHTDRYTHAHTHTYTHMLHIYQPYPMLIHQSKEQRQYIISRCTQVSIWYLQHWSKHWINCSIRYQDIQFTKLAYCLQITTYIIVRIMYSCDYCIPCSWEMNHSSINHLHGYSQINIYKTNKSPYHIIVNFFEILKFCEYLIFNFLYD